jgi:hypothetical protein
MKTFESHLVLEIIILMVLMSSSASSKSNQPLLTGLPSSNLFNVLLSYLNDPTANGGVRIQRMSSTAEAVASLEEETAEASTIDLSNPAYRYPVVKITEANYTQFANQHEWIYAKFFTDW